MLQMVIQYKILVFAMLFMKDNIITMLTPENDSLLAYNAHAELPHAVVEQIVSDDDQHVHKLTQPSEALHL